LLAFTAAFAMRPLFFSEAINFSIGDKRCNLLLTKYCI
jgi:hypothetical protein